MTFTDNDLKRLKETIEACEGNEYGVDLRTLEAKALLARLEAAEAFINHPFVASHSSGAERLYQAWREAKGEH